MSIDLSLHNTPTKKKSCSVFLSCLKNSVRICEEFTSFLLIVYFHRLADAAKPTVSAIPARAAASSACRDGEVMHTIWQSHCDLVKGGLHRGFLKPTKRRKSVSLETPPSPRNKTKNRTPGSQTRVCTKRPFEASSAIFHHSPLPLLPAKRTLFDSLDSVNFFHDPNTKQSNLFFNGQPLCSEKGGLYRQVLVYTFPTIGREKQTVLQTSSLLKGVLLYQPTHEKPI